MASSVLGVDVERSPRVELDGFQLDYPHARPAVDPDGPRPDVLVILIDCWRRDRLAPEYTPNISRWAAEGRVFEDHISAGNSTRYGIFSLIYGLHGSYWFPVLEERRGPVLIDALDELGYEFGHLRQRLDGLSGDARHGLGERGRRHPRRPSPASSPGAGTSWRPRR